MVVKKAVVKLRLLVEDGNNSVQCKFWMAPKLNQTLMMYRVNFRAQLTIINKISTMGPFFFRFFFRNLGT